MDFSKPGNPKVASAAFHVDDAGAYVGVKRSTVYGWIREGVVRDVKLGGRRVILREDLDRILAEAVKPRGGAR